MVFDGNEVERGILVSITFLIFEMAVLLMPSIVILSGAGMQSLMFCRIFIIPLR